MLRRYQSQLHLDLVTSLRSNAKGIFSKGEVKRIVLSAHPMERALVWGESNRYFCINRSPFTELLFCFCFFKSLFKEPDATSLFSIP